MPIYDYVCSNCGHLTEVVHGINDGGPKFCPECGAEGTMTKAFTLPTIHFKGSGWAKKDRSSASRSASSKKEDSTTKANTSGSESGSGSASKSSSGSDSESGSGSASDSGTARESGSSSSGGASSSSDGGSPASATGD